MVMAVKISNRKTSKVRIRDKRKIQTNKVLSYACTKDHLMEALALFTHDDADAVQQNKSRKRCQQERIPKQMKNNIGFHCYSNIALELRKCIVRQHWPAAVQILLILLDAPKSYNHLLWKSCFVILLNHPASTPQLIKDFIRMTMGVDNPEEILHSIRTISL